MKRSFSSVDRRSLGLVAAGSGLIAATYGLVRLAYGLFLPDVQAELDFAAAAAGLISSGASVMYCLGATVGFAVASRRPRTLVIVAASSASVGAAGMAASPSTAAFAAFAIISSAGAGLASPGLVSLVQRNLPAGATADRSQAIVNAGTGPGLVAAGILALMLLPNWRLAWFIVAAFTLAIGAAVLGADRHQGREPTQSKTSGTPVPPRSWFSDHRHIITAAFFLGAGSAAVWNYGRTHLAVAGASEAASVAAWIALGVGGMGVIGTARVMSTRDPRTAWTITTLTVAAATATLAWAPDTNMVVLAACAAFGWGYTAATGALIAWTTHIDATRAPAGTSVLFVILVFGQALGAAAIGALASWGGFAIAFLAASALTLAAATIPLWRKTPLAQAGMPAH